MLKTAPGDKNTCGRWFLMPSAVLGLLLGLVLTSAPVAADEVGSPSGSVEFRLEAKLRAAELVPNPEKPVALTADIRVSGSVEEPAPGEGIDTGTAIRYKITIANNGPDLVPAGALTVVAFVTKNGDEQATIEVSRFAGQNLVAVPSAVCGVGRQRVLQCTNRAELAAEQEISLTFENRHPAPEAGPLSFSISVNLQDGASVVDPNTANNGYQGPAYSFAVQPATTTTPTTVATTIAPDDPDNPTTLVDPTASSMVDPPTTATIAPTTTVAPTTSLATTTTVATTTTTMPPTTVVSTASSVDPNSASANSVSVLGATQNGGEGDGTGGASATNESAVAVAAPGESGGGLPWLLIAGLFAGLLLLGGIGLGIYSHQNRPPPLVDIRTGPRF